MVFVLLSLKNFGTKPKDRPFYLLLKNALKPQIFNLGINF